MLIFKMPRYRYLALLGRKMLFCLFTRLRLYAMNYMLKMGNRHMGIKYRNRTDITAQILEVAASGPVTKSMIMYKAFLSHRQLKEYLGALIEKGLIKYIKEENKYMTTESGIKLLKAMDELSRISSTATNNSSSSRGSKTNEIHQS